MGFIRAYLEGDVFCNRCSRSDIHFAEYPDFLLLQLNIVGFSISWNSHFPILIPKYKMLAYGGVTPPIAGFTPMIATKCTGLMPIIVTSGIGKVEVYDF